MAEISEVGEGPELNTGGSDEISGPSDEVQQQRDSELEAPDNTEPPTTPEPQGGAGGETTEEDDPRGAPLDPSINEEEVNPTANGTPNGGINEADSPLNTTETETPPPVNETPKSEQESPLELEDEPGSDNDVTKTRDVADDDTKNGDVTDDDTKNEDVADDDTKNGDVTDDDAEKSKIDPIEQPEPDAEVTDGQTPEDKIDEEPYNKEKARSEPLEEPENTVKPEDNYERHVNPNEDDTPSEGDSIFQEPTDADADKAEREKRAEQTKAANEHLNEAGRPYYENADGPVKFDKDGYPYRELTDDQKQAYMDDRDKALESIPEGERGDARSYRPETIEGVYENGSPKVAWREGTDGGAEGTRHMETPKEGDVIDRIGSPNSDYFAPRDENGNPVATMKERGLPDKEIDGDITEHPAYHAYQIDKDFSKENFYDAVEAKYGNSDNPDIRAKHDEMIQKLDNYYADCTNPEAKTHPDDVYKGDGGVKTATIDKMFADDDGGGKQYITPFNANELMDLEMISEIKH